MKKLKKWLIRWWPVSRNRFDTLQKQYNGAVRSNLLYQKEQSHQKTAIRDMRSILESIDRRPYASARMRQDFFNRIQTILEKYNHLL